VHPSHGFRSPPSGARSTHGYIPAPLRGGPKTECSAGRPFRRTSGRDLRARRGAAGHPCGSIRGQKGRGPPGVRGPALGRCGRVSRVLCSPPVPLPVLDGGSGEAWRRPRPFLLPRRCRRGRARSAGEVAQRSTRPLPAGPAVARFPGREDCVTLHAVGFTVPRLSPGGRCALTAPFHPCLIPAFGAGPSAVCSLWHFPSPGTDSFEGGPGGWVLPTTVSCRARTFLRGSPVARRPRRPRVRTERFYARTTFHIRRGAPRSTRGAVASAQP